MSNLKCVIDSIVMEVEIIVKEHRMCGKMLHSFRGYKLPKIVKENCTERISNDMILWQCVTDIILTETIKAITPSTEPERKKIRKFTSVEENAIRHASGYTIRKLLDKLKQKPELFGLTIDMFTSMLLESHSESRHDDTESSQPESFYNIHLLGFKKVIEVASIMLVIYVMNCFVKLN